MPRRSSATKYRQGTRYGGARRRRRGSLMSRVRYQRGTSRQQKSQIQSIARLSLRANRILNAHRIFQDWEVSRAINLATPGQWTVTGFMSPLEWNPCLRQDLTPLTQSGCFLREMQFSYFTTNGTKQLPCTVSMFLVTLRPQQNFNGTLTLNDDFITQGAGNAPILNSQVFKVMWSRTVQTFNLLQETVGTGGNQLPTGNPQTSYYKGKTTLRLNFKLRSPSDLSWKQLTQEDMPHYQSLYFLVYFQCEDAASATSANLNYGLKYTTITQD